MGSVYETIDDKMRVWLEKQHLFFVATAPTSTDGMVNCSPKGRDSFAVLGPREVAYADFGGSGIETLAHVKDNQRIVIMFCAFEGPPKIVRFHGRGEAIEPQDAKFDALREKFPPQPVYRNIIRIDVDRISDSCGYGVPNYEYVGERRSTENWLANKTVDDIQSGMTKNNSQSLDGLSGLSNDWKVRPGTAFEENSADD